MRISRSIAYALGVFAAAAMLAACSGNGSPSSGSGLAPSTGMNNSTQMVPLGHHHGLADAHLSVKGFQVHPNHHKSWVSPDARRAPRLMFVSDSGTNSVYIFTMPAMALKGTLTGFSEPQGMCADAGGNIWITNTGTRQIFQYTRTGTLMSTLSDASGYPVGCAVNKATGDLAVTDIFGYPSGAGGVELYKGASGSPTKYTCSAMFEYYFDGYSPGGFVWVSGRDSSGVYVLCAGTPSGLSQLPISGGTIWFPGAVQWDNASGQWIAFDQLCGNTTAACSYPVSGSGVLGTATTYLNSSGGAVCDLVQAVIGANGFKYVGGSDYDYCTGLSNQSDRWAYPAGGTPTNNNSTSGQSVPIGAAISTK